MSREEPSLATICEGIGALKGELRGINTHLKSLDANLILACSQVHELSTEVALQKNIIARHDRKISDLYQKVNIVENTGSINLNELKTEAKARWSMMRIMASILVGLFALTSSILAIIYTVSKIRGKQ